MSSRNLQMSKTSSFTVSASSEEAFEQSSISDDHASEALALADAKEALPDQNFEEDATSTDEPSLTSNVQPNHEIALDSACNRNYQARPYRRRPKTSSRIRLATGQVVDRKDLLTTDYRDLLNEAIQDASTQFSGVENTLSASYAGDSEWTTGEKDVLFDLLAIGRRSISDLCRKIPTKSGSEIQSYLLLLQDHLNRRKRLGAKQGYYAVPDIPAACEVPFPCEEALDFAADSLARHVDKHEAKSWREKYGDEWLINDDVALEIDKRYEIYENKLVVLESSHSSAMSPGLEQGSSGAEPCEPRETDTHRDDSDSAIEFLRPSAFIGLSRHLFMNNAEADSWHSMDGIIGYSEGPAIVKDALEEFHNLAVSFTRRVFQAALYQARTRLRRRAYDSERLTCILPVDVETACKILNVEPRRYQYWATASRRCRVKVYSQAHEQYGNTGRSKSIFGLRSQEGWLLSYDEVERDLGYIKPDISQELMGSSLESEISDSEIEDAMSDSDLFTEELSCTDDDVKEDEDDTDTFEESSSKRNRLSTEKVLRQEERYLNALDHHSSEKHVQRLWQSLHLAPPLEPSNKPLSVPERPSLNTNVESQELDWLQRISKEATWEKSLGHPDSHKFQAMERRGIANRRRRRILKAKIEERLREQATEIGPSLHDSDDTETEEQSAQSLDSQSLDWRYTTF